MTDKERIAAFLATQGVTQVAPGVAYGVDAEADKAKREADKAKREAARYIETEQDHDARMEAAHDAFTDIKQMDSEIWYTQQIFNGASAWASAFPQ